MPLPGFLSYAHADHKAVSIFLTHLKATERLLDVDFWVDRRRLKGGDRWDASIQAAITSAQVHVVLMSPASLNSDYIFKHEIPAIKAKLASGDLVIPVILKECYWHSVGPLQALPFDNSGTVKPITEWPKESGYHRANVQVSEAIQKHFSITPKSLF